MKYPTRMLSRVPYRKPAMRPVERILVLPRDDEVRRKLKHSPTRVGDMPIGFRDDPAGTSWPFDTETRRLLASGHIKRADEAPAPAEPTESSDAD